MKSLISIFLIGFTTLSSLLAQISGSEKSARSAWFIYTSLPEGVENSLSIMAGDQITEITLSKRAPSAPVPIPADGILKLVRKINQPAEPSKSEYETIATVTVIETIQQALVIFMPAKNKDSGLLFDTRVQDLAAFKGGDWLYINATQHQIGIDMDKTETLVQPNETKIFSPGGEEKTIQTTFRYKEDSEKESWKVINSSSIANFKTRREICIFIWDEKRKRIDYHGMTLPSE